jgi:hypothetical protein
VVGDFYGTGIEIWDGFGPVRQLLRPVFSQFFFFKNILDKYATFIWCFFHFLVGKKTFLNLKKIYFSIRTKKLHHINLTNI